MEDPAEILSVIRLGKYMTFAMCREGEPYLVTVNYAYDEGESCFYMHCAQKGKKIDILRENPAVWGQVIEDRGYLDGKCDHAYRSIHFQGHAEFVTDSDEKHRALSLMVDQLESDPDPIKKKHIQEKNLKGVGIIRIRAEALSGKHGPV